MKINKEIKGQVIEQFFVPIKKVKEGDPLPKLERPKAPEPHKPGNTKLQNWLNKNKKR